MEGKFDTLLKKYCLKQEDFFRPLKMKKNLGLRENILRMELEDFEMLLATVGEIDEIKKKLLNRFKLESRNTFSSEIIDAYINLLLDVHDLEDLLRKKQIDFYKARRNEIRDELDGLKKEN